MAATNHEAKKQLSYLLGLMDSGTEVVIERGGTPVARLVPYTVAPRQFGFLTDVALPPDFLDPMTDEELAAWE